MRLFCFILTCLSSNMHGFCRVQGLEMRRRQRAVFTVQNREFHREHIDSSCFRKLDRFSVAMHMELWMSSRIAPKVTRGRSVSTTCFRVHRIKKAKFGSSSQGVYPLHGIVYVIAVVCRSGDFDSTRDRTSNLRFRRPTPYPLGHGAEGLTSVKVGRKRIG